MVTRTRSDTNWVKDLPNYMTCLNNENREELGYSLLSKFTLVEIVMSKFAVACPRIEAPQKLEKFRNRQKTISIDLKNRVRKQENKHLISTEGLEKE